ncbi:DNA-3-methyladenine glycosylase I [Secundilactobacillus collinoides]|nr:DNA-3-methyladenine glycosylase I [Secundilactobacillus collinoides]
MGPNIVYSWLQALGIINDHLTTCDRYEPAIAFGNAHHDALMALKKTL